MVLQAELISQGYHSLVPGIISIFLENVWVPLKNLRLKINDLNFNTNFITLSYK